VSSDFHLLFRYLQNIYKISAANETYIKAIRCLNNRSPEKTEIEYVGQSTRSAKPMAWNTAEKRLRMRQHY
jgi:hypothetical protein